MFHTSAVRRFSLAGHGVLKTCTWSGCDQLVHRTLPRVACVVPSTAALAAGAEGYFELGTATLNNCLSIDVGSYSGDDGGVVWVGGTTYAYYKADNTAVRCYVSASSASTTGSLAYQTTGPRSVVSEALEEGAGQPVCFLFLF
ncbi:hypothetical protein CYMTET_49359 [Cymbomonas tetramitiformis]|uniref:Uncharacterized protein n=1 Tax=Cymbomonas tetramitiformis TaxID=36881 RepID=A0AAE0ETZ3_9CHLO|nr:hypothetical protein CYMTET_49359 [Cymbomonas tetramitiformis]